MLAMRASSMPAASLRPSRACSLLQRSQKTLYNVRFLAILNPRSLSEHVATLPKMQFRIHL